MRSNKELGREKTSRIPIKIVPIESLKKPAWIKMKLPNTAEYMRVKNLLRSKNCIAFVRRQAALILQNVIVMAQQPL